MVRKEIRFNRDDDDEENYDYEGYIEWFIYVLDINTVDNRFQ